MSVAKSLASSIARQVAQLVALADGGGGTSYRAETTAYQARVASGGGSMTAAGLSFVDAIFANAETQSITLQRGYLFGTAVNLPASELEVLELTGDGEPFTLEATGTRYDGLGSLCLSSEVANQGRGYLATESLITQTDATYFLYAYKPAKSTVAVAAESFGAAVSQYVTGSNLGSLLVGTSRTSDFTIQSVGNSTVTGQTIEGPLCYFIQYNAATKLLSIYNPVTGGTASQTLVNHPYQSRTWIGGAEFSSLNYRPGIGFGFGAILKYDGILSTGEMDSVWGDAVGPKKLVDVVLVYGTSVTSGSDSSEGSSEGGNAWKNLVGLDAVQNNTWLQLPIGSMSGKNLTHYAPSDYVINTGSTIVPNTIVATQTIDVWKYSYPTILLIDDQQNFALKTNADYTIDFKYTINEFHQDCLALMPDCKLIVGTQLALQAFTIPGGVPQSYADVEADVGKNRLRDWSVLTRADTDYDAFFEVYTPFNLGYDVGDDGDVPTPATDLPNGDPSLYYDDAQHPNAAGHALFASAVWAALDSVKLY